MMVTVSGCSGLTKAYVSVLSATGSFEISGASRWDDMRFLLSDGGLRLVRGAGDAAHQVGVVDRDLLAAGHDGELAAARIADVGDERPLRRAVVRRREHLRRHLG